MTKSLLDIVYVHHFERLPWIKVCFIIGCFTW